MKRGVAGAALVVAALLATGCAGDEPADEVTLPAPVTGTAGGTATPGTAPTVPLGELEVALIPIAEVDEPVAMTVHPTTGNLYVAEQGGAVREIIVDRDDGAVTYRLTPEPVLDLSAATDSRGEQGLLGLAFSPDGDAFYVNYTESPTGTTFVQEHRVEDGQPVADDPRVLLTIEQPFANHNGGQLAFGPDGYLYIGTGDGGAAGDPADRAQNTNELLGKVLRIDPSQPSEGKPYSIPPDNPFVGGGGAPEVWAYGLRNPWRFSFDTATDDLWIADVGQNAIEEIDWLPATPQGAGRGANLGWNLFEGSEAFELDVPEPPDLVPPIYEYANGGDNCAVTGGYVYRGLAIPSLEGVYLFGDYCAGHVQALKADGGEVVEVVDLGVSVAANSLSSFGQDLDGEVYVLSTNGTVYRIEPA